MSGGSYDYVCFKIDQIEIMDAKDNPRRMAFQQLLILVAKAMHDIEWVDSADYGPGDENEAIDKCLAFLGQDPTLITKAHAFDGLKDHLQEFFKNAEKEKK